ncbi:MAG: putative diguanylate cyclase DgcE [Phycisphaerae bacterium]|nr:putative diguanylate cyclase DgcE [Phycisphaerae bacterium]
MQRSEFFLKILDQLSDGVYFMDPRRRITYWNRGAEQITGFSADEVIGACCENNILTHSDQDTGRLCNGHCPMAQTIADGRNRSACVCLHHKAGFRLTVDVHISPMFNEHGQVIGAVQIFSDASRRIDLHRQLERMRTLSMLDELTRLPNRHFLNQKLRTAQSEFEHGGWPFGLLMMDVDHFKQVNDRFGHSTGDVVLQTVARSLVEGVRPGDVIGRWGGEEFLAIVAVDNVKVLAEVGERLRFLAADSYVVRDGQPINVTLSAGAALIRPGLSITDMIDEADEHLYRSKAAGRNRVTVAA